MKRYEHSTERLGAGLPETKTKERDFLEQKASGRAFGVLPVDRFVSFLLRMYRNIVKPVILFLPKIFYLSCSSLRLVFPLTCPCCQKLLPQEQATGRQRQYSVLCDACKAKLVVSESKQCKFCSGSAFPIIEHRQRCQICLNEHFVFQKVIAIGEYDNSLRLLLLWMKKDESKTISTALALLLLETRCKKIGEFNADLVIPVPMYFFHQVMRRFNSVDHLAEMIAAELKIPCCRHIVRRRRSTKALAKLSREMRFQEICGAFGLVSRWRWDVPENFSLTGKRILLVDDILTTGVTCNEIAIVLLNAGAAAVEVAVIARSEHIDKEDQEQEE